MTTVNELKYAALGGTGHINGAEIAYLLTNGATAGAMLNEMWLEIFLANGATSTRWNEAAIEFLDGQGHTQDNISEQWHSFWTAGGVIV